MIIIKVSVKYFVFYKILSLKPLITEKGNSLALDHR